MQPFIVFQYLQILFPLKGRVAPLIPIDYTVLGAVRIWCVEVDCPLMVEVYVSVFDAHTLVETFKRSSATHKLPRLSHGAVCRDVAPNRLPVHPLRIFRERTHINQKFAIPFRDLSRGRLQ